MLLDPGGWVAWLLVGLVGGWLAGLLVDTRHHPSTFDVGLGAIAAAIGGVSFGFFWPGTAVGFWGSICVAFACALVLAGLARALARRPNI